MIRNTFLRGAAMAGLILASLPSHGANGLIVKLRDAPSHESLAREAKQSAGSDARREQEEQRWQRALAGAGVAPKDSVPAGRAARLLKFEQRLSDVAAARLAERLRQRPEVEWVVPNDRERRLQVPSNPTPNDPRFGAQWWLHRVSGSDGNQIQDRLRGVPGFLSGWAVSLPLSTGVAAARIAVLDTGIIAHPELVGRVLPGHDFVSDLDVANDGNGRDADPTDPGDWVSAADRTNPNFSGCDIEPSSWHGTLIAGVAVAQTNNGSGVAATHWDGRVVPVRVAGKCGADVVDIVDGIRWAAGLPVAGVPNNPYPARIINLSFGGSAACNAAYQEAIDDVRQVGAVVVAAAGNEHGASTRPANCARVIGVAALNRDGFKATYSNFGPTLAIATVGGDDGAGAWGNLLSDGGLLSIYNTGTTTPGQSTYAYLYGTSFAAPIVAGALSLMLSLEPGLSAAQLMDGLRLSARPHVTSPVIGLCSAANPGRCLCTTSTCGAGLLDVEQALLYARSPASYVRPAWIAEVLDNPEVRAAAARGLDRPSSQATPPPAAVPSGGGGGAVEWGWLMGLFAAAALLSGRRRV
jgi:serine protease